MKYVLAALAFLLPATAQAQVPQPAAAAPVACEMKDVLVLQKQVADLQVQLTRMEAKLGELHKNLMPIQRTTPRN